MIGLMMWLSNFQIFFSGKHQCYDLGCSTGTFLKSLSKKNKSKRHHYYGIDEIKDMCLIAKKNNRDNKNVKII